MHDLFQVTNMDLGHVCDSTCLGMYIHCEIIF